MHRMHWIKRLGLGYVRVGVRTALGLVIARFWLRLELVLFELDV